jgi:uncharacterized DUF497 family protein
VFEWDPKEAALDRVLVVAYAVRKAAYGESIRIISAWRVSRQERTAYCGPLED